jgi:hypothetical protein
VSVALTPDGVLEAVEPADVASTLVRREPLCLNLLFGCRDTRFQRLPLIVGRALPGEQSPSLVRRQDATWQLPAPQVLLQLFRSVSLWGLGHCPRGESSCSGSEDLGVLGAVCRLPLPLECGEA